jgi:hypothetical protein
MPRTKGARAGERRQFSGTVLISWHDRSGQTKTVRAKFVDLSDDGAKVVCEPAMDFQTTVFVQAPDHGVMGNASVRYCRRLGLKHVIGLLFSAPASQADQGRKVIANSQPAGEN